MRRVPKSRELTLPCPIAETISMLSGKWKPMIVHMLGTRTYRFGELKTQLSGVSQKVLTQQLRELESDGLIERSVYPEVPPRVEYALSPAGRKLGPILESIYAWGMQRRQGAFEAQG